MSNTKRVFKSKIKQWDGTEKEFELATVPPSASVKQKAKLVHGKSYRQAVEAGLLMREEVSSQLKERNLWGEKQEKEAEELRKFLLEGEKRIAYYDGTLEDIRELALDMREKRGALRRLNATMRNADQETADSHADQAQFDFFVAYCTVYNDSGKPVFTDSAGNPSLEDYIERGQEDVAVEAANSTAEVMYGSLNDQLGKLPENKFLYEYGFVNENFELVNEDGHRVTRDGKLIDEEGRYVNDKGEFVDSEGNPVDADGYFVAKEKKVLRDKNGNPVKPKRRLGGGEVEPEKSKEEEPAPAPSPAEKPAEKPAKPDKQEAESDSK